MRNNRALKETLNIFIDLMIGFAIFFAGITALKYIVLFFYRYTKIELFNIIIEFSYSYRIFINGILVCILLLLIVYLIYRRNKKLYTYLEELEKNESEIESLSKIVSHMPKENFQKEIDIECFSGDIKGLSININNLVKDLKNITLEEKKAQKTKNDLITNVSHDLRTPLTSIIGYLNLIEEDKYKDEVELRYYTDSAYKKAKRLRVLIDDLFELTKYQNDGIALSFQNVDFIEMVWQLISDFQFELEKENLKINTNFCKEKIFLKCDPMKLSRALENLISNSIKYGKNGKHIDIEVKNLGKSASFSIKNYGTQISEFELEHIFDRFYRVDKARNSEVSGSGLGLCITKSIIELHKGNIKAKSVCGVVEFEVILPLV
ncbi:MAG: sensor histidine kinase [Clostridium sp.]